MPIRTRRPFRIVVAGVLVQGCLLSSGASGLLAQTEQATRLLLLQADDRGASSPGNLASFRAGLRSFDADTIRIALRAMGRLHRTALIPELSPRLRHPWPEVRAEAANAVAEAAQGVRTAAPSSTTRTATIATTQSALISRLDVEAEPPVRAAIAEALARLPYDKVADIERAEVAILAVGAHGTVADRLGAADALESLGRRQGTARPLSGPAITLLKDLARGAMSSPALDPARDARIRRLALQSLTTANAIDDEMLDRAFGDPDPQVRRLAVLAATKSAGGAAHLDRALTDRAPIVRLEALRTLSSRSPDTACDVALQATGDADMAVVLTAIDQLGHCAGSTAAVEYLTAAAADRSGFDASREWHRNARSLVALSAAAPDRIGGVIGDYARARIWQLRQAAARAAAATNDTATLEQLAIDGEDRVANIVLDALGRSPRPAPVTSYPAMEPLATVDVRRLVSPIARVSVRGVGRFDLALFTTEAPATVLRFIRLARSGFYDGSTFDGIMPNLVAQLHAGTDPEDAGAVPEGETGMWPHVRGAVGSDPSANSFFIDVVDNPHFDHHYPVFGQILNGVDVVDRMLEGDIIDSIEIVP